MNRRLAERAPTVRLAPRSEEATTQPQRGRPRRDVARRVELIRPVLALRLGTTVGWALRWDADHLSSGVMTVLSRDRLGAQLGAFRDWLRELVSVSGTVFLVYEQPAVASEPLVHNLEGVLLGEIEGHVDHVSPEAATVAQHATGRKAATADAAVAAARARWGRDVAAESEARALCALAWALDVFGDQW